MFLDVLLYDSEAMVWIVKLKSEVQSFQMDNLTDVLGVRRVYNEAYEYSEEGGEWEDI